jgi:isopenicillin-N epimerase
VPDTDVTTAPRPLLLADGRPAMAAWSLDTSHRHLNHGSFGAVPIAAQDEQERLRREMDRNPVVWFPDLPARIAGARAEVAAFLGVAVDDLVLVPNASAGASVVFASLAALDRTQASFLHKRAAKPGNEIVVTDHGYGAVTMGAERLARRWGSTVRTARVPLSADDDEAYEAIVAELSDATGLVVVDHITSATARRLPVARIGAEARRRGIPFLVDAAHVPGLIEAPFTKLDCDFWVGNLHKFACAPRGASALVARGPLRDELHPLIDSWGAADPYPHRFDNQGTVDATAYLAAPAALAFLEHAWGWPAVRAYTRELADYAERIIGAAFTDATGEPCAVDVGMPVDAMRLVRLPRGLVANHAEAAALRDRVTRELSVTAAFTDFDGTGYLRLSAHVYNTAADFEDFAERCVPMLAAWAREQN